MLGFTGIKSIEQSIQNILLTPKGSVPFRPDFGLGVEGLLGGVANPLNIRKEILDQINRFEPRIEVKKINIDTAEITKYKINIIYKIKATGEEKAILINN